MDDLISLKELGALMRPKRVYRTLLRWVQDGHRRKDGKVVYLKCKLVAGRRYSTVRYYWEFIEACSDEEPKDDATE